MWKFLDREVSSPTQRVPIQIQIELMQKCCNPYQIDFFLFQSVTLNSFFIDVLYLWALISWWMILFLKIVNDNKSFLCVFQRSWIHQNWWKLPLFQLYLRETHRGRGWGCGWCNSWNDHCYPFIHSSFPAPFLAFCVRW